MSPPDLDKLLVLPTGCGEQNLVKLGTNWIVGLNLHLTGQLQDHLRVKIRNNVQTGERFFEVLYSLYSTVFLLFPSFSSPFPPLLPSSSLLLSCLVLLNAEFCRI